MLRAWQYFQTVLGVIFRHPIPGVTIIPLLADGRIVLVRRQDTGQWGLPGGLVDWGENIHTTIERELLEETGLEVVKIGRLVGVYSSPNRDPRIHSISILVEVEVKGDFKIQDTLEISEALAFFREDIPFGNLAHDHDQQLQDYLDGLTRLC